MRADHRTALRVDRPQDVAERRAARLRRLRLSALDPEALARLTLELVAVPSVTGDEAALADLVEARCRALPDVEVERLGNALVARIGRARRRRRARRPPRHGAAVGGARAASLEGTRVDRPRRGRHEGRRRRDPRGARALRRARPRRVVVRLLRPRGGPATARTASTRCSRTSRLLGTPVVRVRRRADRRATCTRAASASSTPTSSSTGARRTARGRGRATARSCARCRSSRAPARTAQRPVEVEGLTFHDTLCDHADPRRRRAQRRARPRRAGAQRALRPGPRGGRRARAEIEELVAGEGDADLARREPGRAAAPVRAGARARSSPRRACEVLPEAGLDGRRVAAGRTASRPSTTGRARRTRPTSPASGSTARRSRASRRRSPASSSGLLASHGYPWGHARSRSGRRSGTTSWSSSGTRPVADHAGARAAALRRRARARRRRRARALALDDAEVARASCTTATGSIAEVSGNGTRIAVAHAAERLGRGELARAHRRRARATRGVLDDGRIAVRLGHGVARGPAGGPRRARPGRRLPLRLGRQPALRARPSTTPRRSRSSEEGPRLERHPRFPERTNVEAIAVVDAHRVRMRVWERGVGETQACGSGACAVGGRGDRRRRAAQSPVTVEMPGGERRGRRGRRARPRRSPGRRSASTSPSSTPALLAQLERAG